MACGFRRAVYGSYRRRPSLLTPVSPLSERDRLFNPAFLAVLTKEMAGGFQQERDEPMPVLLLFIGLPLAIQSRSRSALPGGVGTSMTSFLERHPEIRLGFAERATALAPRVRAGLLYALSQGLASLDDGSIAPTSERRRARSELSEEVQEIIAKSRFVGRWFGRAGDQTTIAALWGVRP